MTNLLLHQGSSHVDRNDLPAVITPAATRSWQPIPHNHLLTSVENQLDRFGYQVAGQSHGLSRNGNRYFGLLEIENGDQAADYRCVIGLRNSHDKTFPAGICVGSCVLVCDNLMFAGEITLARKHTRFIRRDLPQLVFDCIGQFKNLFATQESRAEAYKRKRVSDRRVHDLLVQAIDNEVIPVTSLPNVLQEWRKPSYPQFTNNGKSLWRLQNAFTESWKGSNLQTLPRRSMRLHQLLDRVSGYSAAA